MVFGNNIEKYGFLKSEWPLVETVDLHENSGTIYMGKPKTPDADYEDPVWLIKKIEIHPQPNGCKVITKITPDWNNTWIERTNLNYQYI